MSGDTGQFAPSDPTLNDLKDAVLASQIEFLLEELGDPGRYLPHLRSKGVLGMTDCQVIRSKETFRDKIESLISFLRGRETNKNEHSFDVLVEALKKQRVQAHIARGLQKALAKAKDTSSVSDHKRNGEGLDLKSAKPFGEPYQVDDKTAEQDYHPEFGQLPPAPPTQPRVTCLHEAGKDHHPEYGKLPPPSNNDVEGVSVQYGHGVSTTWSNQSECYEASNEAELGGQSAYGSSSTHMSDVFHQSVSTPSGSLSDCSFSSTGQDPMEVTKLKAMVQHLNDRLQEANSRLDERDAKIQDLEKQLQECERRGSKDDRVLSKEKGGAQYAQPLRHNSSPYHHLQTSTVYPPYRYNTVPTVPSNVDHFHHRASDNVVYNMNYSRSTTSASVSTL